MRLKSSTISADSQAHITDKLRQLERQENVHMLCAIESGSRAWGFPSRDSDYDVRFIYARRKEDYLSIQPRRDVIETPLVHDTYLGVPLDLNGWDLRKALELGLKSNAVLIEWLTSPIRYIADSVAMDRLLSHFSQTMQLEAVRFHYDRLARNSWAQITNAGEQVPLKRYCYVLRPVMALHWIAQRNGLPPMDMAGLSDTPGLPDGVIDEMAALFERKYEGGEKDLIAPNPHLDGFITRTLASRSGKPVIDTQSALPEANRLFLQIIEGISV